MAAVRAIKRIRPFIWIPPESTANYKITIEDSSGNEEDITDLVPFFKIENGVTEGIGNFEFTIPNVNEEYTTKWTGMEIFRFYSDYASGDATTARFRGRIEKPTKQRNWLRVTGRSESLFVHSRNVQKQFENVDGGQIIYDLFDSYGQDRFDLTQINTSTGIVLNFTFTDIPFWDAIRAVCEAMEYECYVDANLVVQFFESGTNVNMYEAFIHERNIIETGDFTPDVSQVKNQFKVIGGTVGGVKVKYTANDADSQSQYGVRSETYTDDGIVSFDVAKEFGDALLSRYKNPPQIGEVLGILLATLQPGDTIPLSDPQNGIVPGYYKIQSFVHELKENYGPTTKVVINRSSKKLSRVLRDGIQRSFRRTNTSGDTDDLGYSEVELFDANSGTNQDTVITNGLLQVQSGKSSGIWTSYQFATNDDGINKMKVNLLGDNISNISLEYSINGSTYTSFNRGELLTLGAGVYVIIRLTLQSGAAVDSLEIQYSLI